jgi:peptidoglycan/xylan/chitin deacetylase (PgdA/CDA1 family)
VSRKTLVATYHSIGDGPAPLFLSEAVFRTHLDVLAELGVETLTVSDLASRVRAGAVSDGAVAITFDDGESGAVKVALPLVIDRGMTATVFCVAGRLGGTSDWRTYPPKLPTLRLAAAGELASLAEAGVEIGCHGFEHEPLDRVDAGTARRETADARAVLEDAVGRSVTSFAWPYGAKPNTVAARLIAENYEAACAVGPGFVADGSDVLGLPRVDAHYLRRPAVLRRVAAGKWEPYVRARAVGARVRGAIAPSPSARRE